MMDLTKVFFSLTVSVVLLSLTVSCLISFYQIARTREESLLTERDVLTHVLIPFLLAGRTARGITVEGRPLF